MLDKAGKVIEPKKLRTDTDCIDRTADVVMGQLKKKQIVPTTINLNSKYPNSLESLLYKINLQFCIKWIQTTLDPCYFTELSSENLRNFTIVK